MYCRNTWRASFVLVALVSVSACGGGGSAPAPLPPGSSGNGAVDPATVSFATHYDPTGELLAIYPDAWERQSATIPEVLGFMLERPESATDQFRENVLFVRVPVGTEPTGSDVSGIQIISTRSVMVAGMSGEETIFDATVAGAEQLSLRFMQTAVVMDGYTYAMIYTGERTTFNRLLEVARYMARNLALGRDIFVDMDTGSDLSKPGAPDAVANGEEYFVVSCRDHDVRPFPSDVIARFVYADRSANSPELLVQASVDTGNTGCRFTRPTVSFDGANYLVTYMTMFNGTRRAVGQRVSSAGQLVDATPFDISGNSRGSVFEPVTLFDGARHLVVWYEDLQDPITFVTDRQIRGAFVDVAGQPEAPFIIAGSLATLNPNHVGIYRPQIALGNNQAIVVLDPLFESETRQPVRSIFAQLIDLSGNVLLATPLQIRTDSGENPRFTQVASDGQQYVVGWIEGLLEQSTIHAGLSGVFARVVTASGTLANGAASTRGAQIVAIDSGELPKEYLDLSYSNGEYFFTWAISSFRTDYGVYLSRASQNLTSVSPAMPVAGTDLQTYARDMPRPSHPTVVHAATQALVLWPTEDGIVQGWYVDR